MRLPLASSTTRHCCSCSILEVTPPRQPVAGPLATSLSNVFRSRYRSTHTRKGKKRKNSTSGEMWGCQKLRILVGTGLQAGTRASIVKGDRRVRYAPAPCPSAPAPLVSSNPTAPSTARCTYGIVPRPRSLASPLRSLDRICLVVGRQRVACVWQATQRCPRRLVWRPRWRRCRSMLWMWRQRRRPRRRSAARPRREVAVAAVEAGASRSDLVRADASSLREPFEWESS